MQRSSVVLLTCAGLVNYFDRSALAIANPLIREEMHVSIAQMGLLLSAFLWAYAICQFPGGALVDRLGARRLLGGALSLWSLAQAAAGVCASFGQFVCARALLGVGEAPMFPSAVWVTRAWFPPGRRASITGLWNSASTIGPTLAPPVLTVLMLQYGWRAMFVILGVIGLLVALLWVTLYRDPFEMSGENDTAAQVARPRGPTLAEWRALFAYRATWGLVTGFFGIIFLLWLFSSWLPGYLEIQRHMDVRTTAWVSAVPFAFGALGNLTSGWFADLFVRKGRPSIVVRKVVIVLAILGMAASTYAAASAVSDVVAIGCISAALYCNGASTTMMWCLVGEMAPTNLTASLSGITNFGGYLGGALAPLATGLIVQHTGNFSLAMVLAAGIALLSAILFWVLVPDRAMDQDARGSEPTSPAVKGSLG